MSESVIATCFKQTTIVPVPKNSKVMIVVYRKKRTEHAPILIDGAAMEQVESFKYLGVHITNKLTWSMHTKTVVKRA